MDNDTSEFGMDIKIKSAKPHFKRRLKRGVNFWCVAAIVGLIGTWFSGTTIETSGDFWNHHLSIVVTPMTTIITIIWFGIVVWWYHDLSRRSTRFMAAIDGHPDIVRFNEFGVTWGIENVSIAETSWKTVAFYRLTQDQLILGLPSGVVRVNRMEFSKNIDVQTLTKFMETQGVSKLGK